MVGGRGGAGLVRWGGGASKVVGGGGASKVAGGDLRGEEYEINEG